MTERVHPWMSNTQGKTQPVAFLHGGGGGTPSPLLGRITSVNLAHTVDSIGSLNIFYKKAKVVSGGRGSHQTKGIGNRHTGVPISDKTFSWQGSPDSKKKGQAITVWTSQGLCLVKKYCVFSSSLDQSKIRV